MPMNEAARVAALKRAAAKIAHDLALPGSVVASAIYRTPAYPVGIGAEFVNACLAFRTRQPGTACLGALHRIEAEAGRARTRRWGERTLDLDLLALGDRVCPDVASQTEWRDLSSEAQQSRTPEELILPHPRLQDRAFVLIPLAEVAPDWVHPVLKQSVTDLRDALPPDRAEGIVRLGRL